jgi:hypothetical protein
MRVARAFFYWLILDNFGDAPLVHTLSTELPAKATRRDIYQFVESEITAALPDLSEDKGPAMYGKFNKWAAKALLANVYLNAKVYVGEEKWADCLAQCNDITGQYSLDPNYRDIFRTNNETSPEIIFAIPFDEDRGRWLLCPDVFVARRVEGQVQHAGYALGIRLGHGRAPVHRHLRPGR